MRDAILAPFYDVILSIDYISLMLDGVTSFLRVINVRNTCTRLSYSQTGKLEESEEYNYFFIVSCVLESKKIISCARIIE